MLDDWRGGGTVPQEGDIGILGIVVCFSRELRFRVPPPPPPISPSLRSMKSFHKVILSLNYHVRKSNFNCHVRKAIYSKLNIPGFLDPVIHGTRQYNLQQDNSLSLTELNGNILNKSPSSSLKQARTASVNKQLNFSVKKKQQTLTTYCILEAYFTIKRL